MMGLSAKTRKAISNMDDYVNKKVAENLAKAALDVKQCVGTVVGRYPLSIVDMVYKVCEKYPSLFKVKITVKVVEGGKFKSTYKVNQRIIERLHEVTSGWEIHTSLDPTCSGFMSAITGNLFNIYLYKPISEIRIF